MLFEYKVKKRREIQVRDTSDTVRAAPFSSFNQIEFPSINRRRLSNESIVNHQSNVEINEDEQNSFNVSRVESKKRTFDQSYDFVQRKNTVLYANLGRDDIQNMSSLNGTLPYIVTRLDGREGNISNSRCFSIELDESVLKDQNQSGNQNQRQPKKSIFHPSGIVAPPSNANNSMILPNEINEENSLNITKLSVTETKKLKLHLLIEKNDIPAPKEADNMCMICTSAIPDSIYQPCGHGGFCFSCAKYIIERKSSCQYCRKVEPCLTHSLFLLFFRLTPINNTKIFSVFLRSMKLRN